MAEGGEGRAHVAERDVGDLPFAVPEKRGSRFVARLAVVADCRRTVRTPVHGGDAILDGEHAIERGFEAAGQLGAAGILVPFFGSGDLRKDKELKKADVDNVVSRMKDAAPKAKAAGVMLGLENTCSAKQNLDILDRIGSDAVGCYYDIGNSADNGYDVPAEIRALAGRIAMFHFKDDDTYIGEGKIKLPAVAEAIKAIEYKGWIVLETACPTKNPEADAAKNVQIIRKALG